MSTREHQLDEMPPPINESEIEAARIRMLKTLAVELPKMAARDGCFIVGKGGTMLRLCEGIPRPSTDYDCDTDKPWPKGAQARAAERILKASPEAEKPSAIVPEQRHHPVTLEWTATLARGRKGRIESYINTKYLPELADTAFRNKHVRTRDGMATYTPAHLYQGKADAFMNRTAARDLYDIWYGLSYHIERINPGTRIELHEHLTNNLQKEQMKGWERNLKVDEVLRGNVRVDHMLLGVMDCLEKDPVVAMHAEPDRTLGFFINSRERTISLGLKATEDKPFRPLYTCPQEAARTLCQFVIEAKAEIWTSIGIGKPSGGMENEVNQLDRMTAENIDRWNSRARGREGPAR